MTKILKGIACFLCLFTMHFTQAQESNYYRQEEVKFSNGKIRLAGTLTIPFSEMKHPVVILISGSGVQDSNYDNRSFEMFKAAADYFTKGGFEVLRFNNRGKGGSTGDSSKETIKDLSGDIIAAINFLKSRAEIDSKHIGLCGHCEGGLASSLAASRSKDVNFLIIMSGSAVTGDKLLISQFKNTLKTTGAPEAIIKEETAVREKFYSLIKNGKSKNQVKKELKKYLSDNYNSRSNIFKKQAPDREKYAKNTIEALCRDCDNPAFRFFVNYNPASSLEKLKCPVLATFGGKDVQVSAEENKGALVKAFNRSGHSAYEVKIFPDADHFYKAAIPGKSQEQGELKNEFVPGYIEYVFEWMKNLFPQEGTKGVIVK